MSPLYCPKARHPMRVALIAGLTACGGSTVDIAPLVGRWDYFVASGLPRCLDAGLSLTRDLLRVYLPQRKLAACYVIHRAEFDGTYYVLSLSRTTTAQADCNVENSAGSVEHSLLQFRRIGSNLEVRNAGSSDPDASLLRPTLEECPSK